MRHLNLGNSNGLAFTNRDTALAVAALVGIAHNNAVTVLFVDFHRADFHAFAADIAFGFVNDNYVHKKWSVGVLE
jgi:prepilin-type processing-associated H-X9-DG protein